ncbi:archease [Methanolobus sp. ZRKC3]|uniref:archease n=1 Tax=Methanolobus sp. ZRKC3 TaxID=3125786 RepID=UPI00324994D8
MTSSTDQKFEYLEHTADAKFIAYGKTLKEAFENAALAMMNVMIDTDTVQNVHSETIELNSADMDALLFDWLSEVLFVFEVENIVFNGFIIDILEQQEGECHLVARLFGEPIDLSVHKFDTEVKAATYNDMHIGQTDNGWMVRATVDT